MNPFLKVEDLHIEFPTRHGTIKAVSGASFSLKKGETLAIVGESGSGKSALAKSLVKLFAPHTVKIEGKVFFEGKDLLSSSEKELQQIRGKQIGMIFQDPMTSLNPTLPIGEQIIEGYQWHNPSISYEKALAYTEELLTAVGIPYAKERLFSYPHTLSGGMRQKALIALALATNPKLIIADEPTTALDATVQMQILSFMKDFQRSHETSILLITHDLGVVAGFCDRVIVMYAGEIVESAPVEELFETPRHPYTQRLLRAIPRIDLPPGSPLIPIDGTPPLILDEFIGCPFASRCTEAMQICKENKVPLLEVGKQCFSRCFLHQKAGSYEP
jgi:oligopeptide transport system ATP-binding protein